MNSNTVNRHLHKPYVRGPHVRYFLTSLLIAFSMAMLLLTGFVLFLRFFYS
jgi:hypothetical protein